MPPSVMPTNRVVNSTTNSGTLIIANDGFSRVNGLIERFTGVRLAIANTTTMIKIGIRTRNRMTFRKIISPVWLLRFSQRLFYPLILLMV